MAVVNPMLSPAAIVYAASPAAATTAAAAAAAAVGAGGPTVTGGVGVKDSRWLTLDVCREFTRNKCSRSDDECRFAHPPPNVEVQNGRVMCCFDSIKVRPVNSFHPGSHLNTVSRCRKTLRIEGHSAASWGMDASVWLHRPTAWSKVRSFGQWVAATCAAPPSVIAR